jgi:hypothetical protein
MENDRHIWRAWAYFLQRWGMKELAASLLEAAGPLSILSAQVFYVTQPFYKQTRINSHLEAISRVLDDRQTTQAFLEFLREAPTH